MERLTIETKVMAEDDGAVSGIAWKFGAGDRIGDWIEPGAFKGTAMPLPLLFGHDQNDPIGTWNTAEEKADGLHVTGKLLINDLPRAREVRALVAAGAVRGISIGFVTRKAAPRPGGCCCCCCCYGCCCSSGARHWHIGQGTHKRFQSIKHSKHLGKGSDGRSQHTRVTPHHPTTSTHTFSSPPLTSL